MREDGKSSWKPSEYLETCFGMPSPQPEMIIVVGSSAGTGLLFSLPLRRYTRSDIGVKPGNGIGLGDIMPVWIVEMLGLVQGIST